MYICHIFDSWSVPFETSIYLFGSDAAAVIRRSNTLQLARRWSTSNVEKFRWNPQGFLGKGENHSAFYRAEPFFISSLAGKIPQRPDRGAVKRSDDDCANFSFAILLANTSYACVASFFNTDPGKNRFPSPRTTVNRYRNLSTTSILPCNRIPFFSTVSFSCGFQVSQNVFVQANWMPQAYRTDRNLYTEMIQNTLVIFASKTCSVSILRLIPFR